MASVKGRIITVERGFTLEQVILRLLEYMETTARRTFQRNEEEKNSLIRYFNLGGPMKNPEVFQKQVDNLPPFP